jgi:hypothetical protein
MARTIRETFGLENSLGICLRPKAGFAWRFKAIWAVQFLSEKYLACAVGQINGFNERIPHLERGALRDRHERWARNAMDEGTATDECRCRGRRSRVVLDPPTLGPSWRRCLRASAPATVTNKPGSPRRARSKPLKPLRRECRSDAAHLWRLHSCAFYLAHGAMGAIRASGIPRALT